MGEYAEMMLDGTCCACCGEFLGTDAGYPIYCPGCEPDFIDAPEPLPKGKPKVACPECGKRVKEVGLNDHMRDVHGGSQ